MNKKLLIPCLAVSASLFAGQITINNAQAEGIGGGGPRAIFLSEMMTLENPMPKNLLVISEDEENNKFDIECDEESTDICSKVEFDEKDNVLVLSDLGSDKNNIPFQLSIMYLENLTVKFVGENNLSLYAIGTDVVMDGDGTMNCSIEAYSGIDSISCMEVDYGTVTLENGTYNFNHYTHPILAVMHYNQEDYKETERIFLGDNMELKGKNKDAKLIHIKESIIHGTYADYEIFGFDTDDLLVDEIHIAPKAKKQTNVVLASTETDEKNNENAKEKSEKAPDTGLFPKELSATLASIFGTVSVVSILALLVIIAKKKSKKGISYY